MVLRGLGNFFFLEKIEVNEDLKYIELSAYSPVRRLSTPVGQSEALAVGCLLPRATGTGMVGSGLVLFQRFRFPGHCTIDCCSID